MNKKDKYFGDPRYEKVWEQMQLLQIEDVSTKRQDKNGTIVWKLPIKDQDTGILIEVASFASGYVRNQGKSCHSNYQLNKRYFTDEYYPEREITDDYTYGKKTGKYIKYKSRHCKRIPIEIDRLEYLISYCLKNYYIKNANRVPNGDYVSKWTHEWELKQAKDKYKKLDDFCESSRVFNDSMYEGRNDRVKDLENKLDTIQRIADYE